MIVPDNPVAFPEVPGGCNAYEGKPGMSLRDYFAGQALAGLLASCNYDRNPHGYAGDAAHDSYVIADAMLAIRAKVLP